MSSLTSSFEVQGMSCAACVGKVEKAISALEGVERVRANFVSKPAPSPRGVPS